MIELMELSETKNIMDLWRKKMKELTKLDEEINDFSIVVEEVLGHANVYVAHKDKEISGFATVIEGFYISDIFFDEPNTGEALISELKKRYDELQIDLHHEHPANELLNTLGFSKLKHGEHDVLRFEEIEYEWLGE